MTPLTCPVGRARRAWVLAMALAAPALAAPPTNDNFAAALALAGLTGSTAGDLTDATLEHGEKGSGRGSNSVWWSWQAPVAGWYAFDTSGSSCDTMLGVWQGTNVATLSMAGTNDNELGTWSLVAFEASTAKPYYLQVSGTTPADTGAVALRWSPLVLVNQSVTTSETHTVWFDRSGFALSQPLYTVTTQRVWMNTDNYLFSRSSVSVPSMSSATLTHPSGKALFTLQPFQKAPRSPRIVMFRDASVLLRGSATQGTQLAVNGMGATNFVAGAALVIISNFHNALALERGVYVTLTNGAGGMGALFAKGTLARVQWEFPIAPGAFAALFDSGCTLHTNAVGGALTCTIARKGRETGAAVIPLPASGTIHVLGNSKGSVLSWVKTGATNGPLTLMSAKAEQLFTGFVPQQGPLFSQCLFDSRRMVFVYGTPGTNADVAVYTAKAPPAHIGTVTVPHFNRVLFDDANLLTVSTVTGITTVVSYQPTLKEKWACDAPGSFFGAYGGGVFATRVTTPSNDVYRVYASGAQIAKYTYTRK